MELSWSLPVRLPRADITHWPVPSHWASIRSCCLPQPTSQVSSKRSSNEHAGWHILIQSPLRQQNWATAGKRRGGCHSATGMLLSISLSTDPQSCPFSSPTHDLCSEGQVWVVEYVWFFNRFLFPSKKKKSLHTKIIPINCFSNKKFTNHSNINDSKVPSNLLM